MSRNKYYTPNDIKFRLFYNLLFKMGDGLTFKKAKI